MGIRQPSKIGVMYAQAKAGAEQQKKARENLKDPGKSALGGSANMGTAMVAATGDVQNKATEKVKDTTQTASADLVANDVGTSNQELASTMVVNTPPPSQPKTLGNSFGYFSSSGLPPSQQNPNLMGWAPIITGYDNNGKPIYYDPTPNTYDAPSIVSASTGSVFETTKTLDKIEENIASIENTIKELDDTLKTANARDAAAIVAEQTRLNKLLDDFQKMKDEQNLGQIAKQSTFETEMEARERLLAEEGNEISKLKALFGGGFNSAKYGALASQMYGKDLELLEEQAASGLAEREMAKNANLMAMKEFDQQLGLSKKTFEEKLGDATDRVEILKKPLEELKTVTKTEVEKLFGVELADKLFDFDDKGYISNTNTNQVRQVYVDAKKNQEDILADQKLNVEKSVETEKKELDRTKTLANSLSGDARNLVNNEISNIDNIVADFYANEKYYKTPKERNTAKAKLENKIRDIQQGMANKLVGLIQNPDTNQADRSAAVEIMNQLGLNHLLTQSNKNKANAQINESNKGSGFNVLAPIGLPEELL